MKDISSLFARLDRAAINYFIECDTTKNDEVVNVEQTLTSMNELGIMMTKRRFFASKFPLVTIENRTQGFCLPIFKQQR